jgi:hypothetical protein
MRIYMRFVVVKISFFINFRPHHPHGRLRHQIPHQNFEH